jgi:hypothetical protein
MKKILFITCLFPLLLFSQFENRTHILGGANLQLSTQGYQLYNSYIMGGETILGFRPGKIFFGVGVGAQYSGSGHPIDSIGTEIIKVNIHNVDIPLFIDLTYGKKFYVEVKLGYSFKLSNIKDYQDINTNTLFNCIGFGYSIPLSQKVYLDIAAEGKFDYLFSNTISQDFTSIYFMPILKAGLRFNKSLNK